MRIFALTGFIFLVVAALLWLLTYAAQIFTTNLYFFVLFIVLGVVVGFYFRGTLKIRRGKDGDDYYI